MTTVHTAIAASTSQPPSGMEVFVVAQGDTR